MQSFILRGSIESPERRGMTPTERKRKKETFALLCAGSLLLTGAFVGMRGLVCMVPFVGLVVSISFAAKAGKQLLQGEYEAGMDAGFIRWAGLALTEDSLVQGDAYRVAYLIGPFDDDPDSGRFWIARLDAHDGPNRGRVGIFPGGQIPRKMGEEANWRWMRFEFDPPEYFIYAGPGPDTAKSFRPLNKEEFIRFTG